MSTGPEKENRYLERFRVPDPPSELRGKVMAAAVKAMQEERKPDRWTEVWESRPLRVAWAASVSTLILANLFLPPGRPGLSERGAGSMAELAENDENGLAEIANLPRLRLDALPLGAMLRDSSRDSETPADKGRTVPEEKENAS